MFKNIDGGFVTTDSNTTGYTKPGYTKPTGYAVDMYGARFSTEIYTRGCHWFPRLFT
jgi:hypothetical protein